MVRVICYWLLVICIFYKQQRTNNSRRRTEGRWTPELLPAPDRAFPEGYPSHL